MYTWIFVSGIIFTLYNAWGGGANDCANSFATAVGSKALTLKQAILIASVFEFLGALLMGSHVTNTVRKGIVSLEIFEDNPVSLHQRLQNLASFAQHKCFRIGQPARFQVRGKAFFNQF